MNRTFDADENYAVLVDYCDGAGVKIGAFINKVIAKELKKLGLIE